MTKGQFFQTLRKERGYTLAKVSELTGISISVLSRFEKDKGSINLAAAETLFNAVDYWIIPVPKELIHS